MLFSNLELRKILKRKKKSKRDTDYSDNLNICQFVVEYYMKNK